jgi:hypothetical protein
MRRGKIRVGGVLDRVDGAHFTAVFFERLFVMTLVPCASCGRHVKASEPTCPFCQQLLPEMSRLIPAANRRLERLAAFTFAATLAVTGCALGDEEKSDAQERGAQGVRSTGAPAEKRDEAAEQPPVEDRKEKETTSDASVPPPVLDDGGVMAMYGMPSFEPNPVDEADGGTMMPMYGAPASGT